MPSKLLIERSGSADPAVLAPIRSVGWALRGPPVVAVTSRALPPPPSLHGSDRAVPVAGIGLPSPVGRRVG